VLRPAGYRARQPSKPDGIAKISKRKSESSSYVHSDPPNSVVEKKALARALDQKLARRQVQVMGSGTAVVFPSSAFAQRWEREALMMPRANTQTRPNNARFLGIWEAGGAKENGNSGGSVGELRDCIWVELEREVVERKNSNNCTESQIYVNSGESIDRSVGGSLSRSGRRGYGVQDRPWWC
jgi:hypothetical protein